MYLLSHLGKDKKTFYRIAKNLTIKSDKFECPKPTLQKVIKHQDWIWQAIRTWPKAFTPHAGTSKNYQVVKIQIAASNKIAQQNRQAST
jgi:hypothetical protein